MDFIDVINSWKEASKDLGIKLQTPFIMITDGNVEMRFELLIECFGSTKGTIVFFTDNMKDFNITKQYGYYCSALNVQSYAIYDRQLFIDTMNDWGYFGDKSRIPKWYTGKPWTD